MPKKIGVVLLITLVIVMFFAPARRYVVNLLQKNKGELTEVQIIGRVTSFNPRVKEIQKILEDLEFEPGSIDGRMGARTRMAIKEFQKRKNLIVNGKIDSKTWSELNNEKEKLNQKSSVQDNIMSYRLKSKDRVKQAQIALKKAGLYSGNVDGKLGFQTTKAIKAFQKSKGLNPDGIIGVKTREALNELLKE